MELRRLRYFAAVARTLHFGRAAAELRIAQPALSQQIRALEAELGVRLLDRDSRNVRLTQAGTVLLAEATQLLRAADRARRRTIAAAAELHATLRVSYARSAPGWPTTAIIDEFRRRFDHTTLHLSSGVTAMHVAGLLDGGLDVAFVHPPLLTDDLECLVLADEPMVAAVREDHPAVAAGGITVSELRLEPVISWPREHSPGLHDRIYSLLWGSYAAAPIVRIEPDEEQLLRAVSDGAGIAVITSSRAAMLSVPGARTIPIAGVEVTAPIGIAWYAGDDRPTVASFVAVAHDVARASTT